MVGDEPFPFYARVLTSYYLGGLVPRERLWLVDGEWYRRQRIQLFTGRRAKGLSTGACCVTFDDGTELAYDRQGGKGKIYRQFPGW